MNKNKITKRRYSRPLYSSQTTRTPQHTTNNTRQQHITASHQEQHTSSQTPNNATNQAHRNHPPTTTSHTQPTPGCRHTTAHIHPQKHKNKLLRKEVIQPHLPVRLPCYDFVPIADPTFDSSLTSLGHWLRVLPTFMT